VLQDVYRQFHADEIRINSFKNHENDNYKNWMGGMREVSTTSSEIQRETMIFFQDKYVCAAGENILSARQQQTGKAGD